MRALVQTAKCRRIPFPWGFYCSDCVFQLIFQVENIAITHSYRLTSNKEPGYDNVNVFIAMYLLSFR